jgi:hypothetical protein
MSLFHSHITLPAVDPLGGGLREEILAEQEEQSRINLEEDLDDATLSQSWQGIVEDLEKDPSWFSFADEE